MPDSAQSNTPASQIKQRLVEHEPAEDDGL